MIRPRDVLDFWFGAGPEKWFTKSDAFDAEIRRRFGETHAQAAEGKLDGWAVDAQGSLALILVLDQFSRNLWRNDHRAFAQDQKALGLADEAVRRRYDVETPVTARKWFYMPYMHAEDLAAQERGLIYFAQRLDDPRVARLRAWCETEGARLRPVFERRRAEGEVRECHGDLHLANAVVLGEEVTAFDCIEFDPDLRWIDVQSEVAFLAMDLMAHARGDLAFRFLDAWLARSGDYEGVPVLRYYLVYRALDPRVRLS